PCASAPAPDRADPAHSCAARSGTSPCSTSSPSETASAPRGGRACRPDPCNVPCRNRLLLCVRVSLAPDFFPPDGLAVYVPPRGSPGPKGPRPGPGPTDLRPAASSADGSRCAESASRPGSTSPGAPPPPAPESRTRGRSPAPAPAREPASSPGSPPPGRPAPRQPSPQTAS